MKTPKADLTWMQFGKDIEIAVGHLPPEKTEQQLREDKLAELKISMYEQSLGQFGLVADFSRQARIVVSIEKSRKRKLGDYNDVVSKNAKLMRETQTIQEFFDETISKFRVRPEELMVFNPLDGNWISYIDVLERHPSTALTLAEIRVLKRHTTEQVDVKSVLAKLESDIFDVERLRVKINVNGNFGKRDYKNLWPTAVSSKGLVRNWIINRLGTMQVRPEEVTFTLPDGRKASGLHLVTTNSKLRISEFRFKATEELPVGMRPVNVGTLENRILQQEDVMVIIRRDRLETVPYFDIKRTEDLTPLTEYVRCTLGRYEIAPEEVVFIHGETMRPFTPDEFYTMGQLRASYKGKTL